ncbi:serine/threonine/tyrosine-protein kinase HT1-like [Mercurialis annua]|uniref:serine/threonine/tyrosine-protein kinase HT1-like n=1 Tax=Mercurialis annua TaxID=3986 RepID=UPI00215F995B|nr:serine/threonine/tyrosine-protein kinase HT1-like [Mercurialis annua]
MGNALGCTNTVSCFTRNHEQNSVNPVNSALMDLSMLVLGHRFAGGTDSTVCHGSYQDLPVAVKIITPPDKSSSSRIQTQYYREVGFLSRLHHPNVVKLVGGCKNRSDYYIVTEYLPEGSLRVFLNKYKSNGCQSLSFRKLLGFALDIARGMEYIHSQGVIHRDLKPENVLIDQDLHAKIADFGSSCLEADCNKSSSSARVEIAGTYRWMAPEVIEQKGGGTKADVYSFGLILWQLVTGRTPFEDLEGFQVLFAVVNKDLRPVIPEDCCPALRDLIERCWSKKPCKRPEFRLIVQVLQELEREFDT